MLRRNPDISSDKSPVNKEIRGARRSAESVGPRTLRLWRCGTTALQFQSYVITLYIIQNHRRR